MISDKAADSDLRVLEGLGVTGLGDSEKIFPVCFKQHTSHKLSGWYGALTW